VLRDRLVHKRLREHRLVQLVVAHASVPDNVDHHVLIEGLSVLGGKNEHTAHFVHIVRVHVEDRGVNCLS
jgi:hypothetical protein